MADTDVVVSFEIGFAHKRIDKTILGNYYAIIATLKGAKENGLILGLGIAVWGV